MIKIILAILFIFSPLINAEEKPKLILLTVKGEGIDLAAKRNIRVAIEKALKARYTVYSGSQVDDKIEREFVKQCRIHYDDAEMANSECMKSVAGFFIADYIATPQISAQVGGYLLTLEIRDAYTSESYDPYSGNCVDCSVLELADAFRAMILSDEVSNAGTPVFINSTTTGDSGSSGIVDLTAPVKPQDRGKLAVLLLDSEPSGAEVWLGDIKAGKTPYQNLQLSSGQNLNITLKAQNYRDLPVQLTLQPGSNTPTPFKLIPAFGSLMITSEPSGADVYISGELVGQTPYQNQRLASAKYLIDIRKALHVPLSNQAISIEDAKLTDLSYKLQANFGNLAIASDPAVVNIKLEVDGREVYKGTTPANLKLEPATYLLSASKAGYAKRRFEVNIARNQDISISHKQLQLRQLLGTAIIASEPTIPEARVLINGKDYGTVPTIVDLPVGTYRVIIQAEQFNGQANLQVRDGEQQTMVVKLRENKAKQIPKSNSVSRAPFGNKHETKLVINTSLSPSGVSAWTEAINGFKTENPDIEVSWNSFDHGAYKTAIRNFLTADDGAPDIANWYAGNRMAPFVEAGLFEDVSDVWEEYGLKGSLQSSLASMTMDGKQWGVPYTYYQWGIYYRKDIFAKLGIAVTKTWDELMAAQDTLLANDITPFTIGTKYLWTASGVFDYLNLRTNGYEFHMDLTSGKIPYTDPRVVQVFDNWQQMRFIDNHAALDWRQGLTPMVSGEAAMYVMGNFAVHPLREAGLTNGQLGFMPFPEITPGIPMAEDAPTDTIHIPAKAKNKANARKFMAYLARADVQTRMNASLGQLPVNSSSSVPADDPFLVSGFDLLSNAYALAQFYDRDAPAAMAKAGMKGFQEFMVKPERKERILERLEKARQKYY